MLQYNTKLRTLVGKLLDPEVQRTSVTNDLNDIPHSDRVLQSIQRLNRADTSIRGFEDLVFVTGIHELQEASHHIVFEWKALDAGDASRTKALKALASKLHISPHLFFFSRRLSSSVTSCGSSPLLQRVDDFWKNKK